MQKLELESINALATEWLGPVSVRQSLISVSAKWIFKVFATCWLLQVASAK